MNPCGAINRKTKKTDSSCKPLRPNADEASFRARQHAFFRAMRILPDRTDQAVRFHFPGMPPELFSQIISHRAVLGVPGRSSSF
jgi:hypothetical protein